MRVINLSDVDEILNRHMNMYLDKFRECDPNESLKFIHVNNAQTMVLLSELFKKFSFEIIEKNNEVYNVE